MLHVCIATLLTGLLVTSALGASAHQALQLTVLVGSGTFRASEPISMELVVRYDGRTPLTLRFATAQRYDFHLEEADGKVLWRWSEGKMFAQMLGQLVLSPDHPELRYQAVLEHPLAPGRYRVRGWLTTLPRPLAAVAEITIR